MVQCTRRVAESVWAILPLRVGRTVACRRHIQASSALRRLPNPRGDLMNETPMASIAIASAEEEEDAGADVMRRVCERGV